ncbi:alpha/beta hydrolase [Acetatifactor muris]|uniref:AB hydrolase superfamily protein YdjP n=1 Tax=Acetatifactor muris TaxID=879566 RepID=A0A2K4ZQ53_9FIRM|nr:alpha/beta hydrolase [Acetatifactor muris]MCR2051017.1 alpha/beta hydrolase [Acetatifactor muris]SOY32575.1 AB hydrolase superfamily protein YdjP [Acetatifactor muris]
MKQIKSANSPITYFVSRTGQVEWILFIHAAFVNHNMFKAQFAYFENKYNMLAVDIIGHGQSTDTQKGDTIDKMANWIFDILKAENIEKVHIVGVSLGAVLAQDFANRYPCAVSSLACFGGYDINHFDTKLKNENSARQKLMMLKALFSVTWFAKANRKISAYTSQAQNDFFAMNVLFPKKSFRFLATLNRMVNKYKTGQRNYPLLIGCGKFDIPMELEAIKAWKSSEPDCTVVLFENAGHCVNMDVPREFNKTMEEFWKGASQ